MLGTFLIASLLASSAGQSGEYGQVDVVHYDIAVISRVPDGAFISNTEEISIDSDCRDVSNINITVSVKTSAVRHGDIFHLYREVTKLMRTNYYDIVMVDQDLAQPRTVQAIFDTTSQRANHGNVLMIKEDQDTQRGRCIILDHYHNTRSQGDNLTEPLVSEHHESDLGLTAVPLDLWVLTSTLRAQLVLDIARHAEWNQFLILFDEEYDNQAGQILDLAGRHPESIFTLQQANLKDWQRVRSNVLQYFETSTDFNFVVLATMARAEQVLKMVMSLETEIGKRILVTGRSNLLIVSQGGDVTPDMWLFRTVFDNVAILSDLKDVQNSIGEEENLNALQVLTTLLYKTERRELAVVGTVDYHWSYTERSEVFPNIKFGFNGRLFIVTTNMWDPYVYRHTKSNGEYEYTGFCIDMAYELARTLNFTIQFTEPPDGGWGADMGNNSWSGMVGQVLREEVDMIIAPIGVTMAREQVIDFTFAFFYDDSAVILKKPDPDESKWRTYIDIFRMEVLYCIFAALLIAAALLTLLEYLVKLIYKYDEIGEGKVFARTYLGSIFYLFGAMFNQGGQNLPFSITGRVFISSWWLFCLVVAGTFGGNLIAVLTVTKDKPPFNTLAEMAAQSDYTFGTLGNSMWTTLFETSPRPEFQAISRKMEGFYANDPSVYSYDPNVHLKRVKQGGYAYIADNGMFTNWLAYNCDLMILKEKFFPAKYAIGLPNHSAYTKLFSEQVVKVYESGLLQVWVKKWWPSRSFCAGALVTEARTLTLIDVQSAFYLLGVGAAAAGTLLVSELVFPLFRSLFDTLDVVPDAFKKKSVSVESLHKVKSGTKWRAWR